MKQKKSPREGPLHHGRYGAFHHSYLYREAPTHLLAVDASDVDQRHHAIALDHLLSTLRCHVCDHRDLVFRRRETHHVHNKTRYWRHTKITLGLSHDPEARFPHMLTNWINLC